MLHLPRPNARSWPKAKGGADLELAVDPDPDIAAEIMKCI